VKDSSLIKNSKSLLFLAFLALIFLREGYGQTQADSLEIYHPFFEDSEINRIMRNLFTDKNPREGELIKKLTSELEQAEKSGDIHLQMELLAKIGKTYTRADDNSGALEYYFRALKLAESLQDTIDQGLLNLRIGGIYVPADTPLQTDYRARGRALLKNIKDDEIQAILLYASAREQKDSLKTDSLAREALKLQQKVLEKNHGNPESLEHLANYLNGLWRFEEAARAAEQAGNTRLQIIYLNNAGMFNFLKGDLTGALKFYQKAKILAIEERLPGLLKNTYHSLSKLYSRTGDYKKAADFLQLHTIIRDIHNSMQGVNYYVNNVWRYEVDAREKAKADLARQKAKLEDALNLAYMLEVILFISVCGLISLLVMGYFGRKKLRTANILLVEQKEMIDQSRAELESANSELTDSQANLNAAQELALVANWEWQSDKNRFSFSEMLPKLFGIPEADLRSNFQKALLSVIHPEDRKKVMADFAREEWLQGEYESRYRVIRGDETRWFLARFKYITHDGEMKNKISGTVQDITLQTEREEARIRIEADRLFAIGLIEQQEAERKRIANEIHDGIGQEIVALNNQAELALTDKHPERASADFLQMFVRIVPELLQDLRRISKNLRPVHLERLGLTETMRDMVRQAEKSSRIKIIAEIDNIDHLISGDQSLHIYRIAQEALNNIIKHSGADLAQFRVRLLDGLIKFSVQDNGKGFNAKKPGENGLGFGLYSMEARAKLLGAEFSLASSTGNGMQLELTIPLV